MYKKLRIAIIGRTEILYNTTLALINSGHSITCLITSKEAPEYTKTAADFNDLSKKLKIPFIQGTSIDSHFQLLKKSKADIAVSINYNGIIPQKIIELFPLGILNAHGGDLPRYRGNACQAWAIINGETKIGLCIHKMIGGELDSGDIIARDYLHINHNTKITKIWKWMTKTTPQLIINSIENLSENSQFIMEKQSTDVNKALRCYPRLPEDGKINWSLSALEILRLINATNRPYQGAFCDFEGNKLIIWDAELVEDEEKFCAIPGQVTKISNSFIEVACGTGKIRLFNVQICYKTCSPNLLIKSIRVRLK